MNISAITRKAIADVTRRRGRTVLAVLGIMIGVLGLTAINVAGDAINSVFANGNDASASPNISFSVLSIDPALATTLAGVPNVQTVQIDTLYQARWHAATKTGHINTTIIGYRDFRHVKLSPFQIISGRLPGDGEIVMEVSNRQLQAVGIGDVVTIDTPHGPTRLRVVGLARTVGLQNPLLTANAQAYMSSAALSRITDSPAANDIEIRLNDRSKANETAQAIAAVLHTHHITVLNASVVQVSGPQSVSNGLLGAMRVFSLFALILTSFLIINTVTTLIAEQSNIIGTMKAIGGSRQEIVRGYLLSIAIYGGIGTVLGIGLGIVGGYELASFMLNLYTTNPGPMQIAPGVIIVSLIAGLGVPLMVALPPLWVGTGITVHEAMAAYGVNNRDNNSHNTIGQHLLWVPQTTWLSVRGIFRKRGRAILTLLALTLSGVVFLAIQTTTLSFTQFTQQFSGIYRDDAAVTLAMPQPYDKLRNTALSVPNVARIERIERKRVNTKWGLLEIVGIEADTHMYVKHLIAGRWFAADEKNVIIINQVVANKSGLKVGDMLTFSNALHTVRWRIIGEVYDPDNPIDFGLGLMPLNNYAAFEGMPTNMAQGFMVQGADRSQRAVDMMASRLDATLSQTGAVPSVETEHEKFILNQDKFAIVNTLFYAVGAIVALVGILGVFNTLTTSVLERRREIGVLRSLGATNWRVASVFWTEGVALAIIAWLVGIVLGIPGAYGFVVLLGTVFIQIPFTFTPLMLLYMLGFIIAIALLASFLPVLSATRVRIADTLRYE